MTTIQAIETRYAGCRFRSRLEARWAVFFDAMSIRWEYEPQGVMVDWRLDLTGPEFPYLPDFWLPDHNVWGEVKGSLTSEESRKLLNAAAYLSDGSCRDTGGNDLVLFGPIPRPTSSNLELPVRLHMHKGTLGGTGWPLSDPHGDGYLEVAGDNGDMMSHPELLLDGLSVWWRTRREGVPLDVQRINDAYQAARSARFEHGE